jgi:hypothetical protein
MATSELPIGKDDIRIVYSNITLSIDKSELCPLCLVDFVSDKNIVVPDCGHSMHISCFCSLISYNLRDCSVCKKSVINKNSVCTPRLPRQTNAMDRARRVPTPSPARVRGDGRPVHTVYPEDSSYAWG